MPISDETESKDAPGALNIDGDRFIPETMLGTGGEMRILMRAAAIDLQRPTEILSPNGDKRELSSGERTLFAFAVQAVARIEQASLILFDEPETHLHPHYISLLLDILHGLLEATGSCAIVTTHSPYVVREVPRSRVRIISLENRQPVIDTPRLQTFGANVDAIATFVFGDSDTHHLHQRLLDRWIDAEFKNDLRPVAQQIDWLVDSHGDKLNVEALSYIARRLDQRAKRQ